MRINPNDGVYRMHYGEDTLGVGNYAPVSGTVVFAGYDRTGTGLGWCVGIQQDGTGTATVPQVIWWIAHHGESATVNPLLVSVNQHVTEGKTYLGPKGESGAAKGVHCHTERRYGGLAVPGTGQATNPRDYYTSTAGGGTEPFPQPEPTPESEEDDDMPKNTGVWYLNQAGKAVMLVFNPGSGFATEWSSSTASPPADLNNQLAAAFDTGSFVQVSAAVADRFKASCAEVRAKAGDTTISGTFDPEVAAALKSIAESLNSPRKSETTTSVA
jgi:hypothetical protein